MMIRFRRLGIVRSIENLPSLANNSHLLTMNISLSKKLEIFRIQMRKVDLTHKGGPSTPSAPCG